MKHHSDQNPGPSFRTQLSVREDVVYLATRAGSVPQIPPVAPRVRKRMSNHLTMLAYDMNNEPLSFGHDAPMRLRNEEQLGFTMVRWVKGIGLSRTSRTSAAATTKTMSSSATANPSDPTDTQSQEPL